MKCDECHEHKDDVLNIAEYWSCGGNNCFHFEWRKFENEELKLCQDCESEMFLSCENCGSEIDCDCIFGMEAFDDNGEYIGHRCPGCKKLIQL